MKTKNHKATVANYYNKLTIAATLGYYTDHQVQSVVLRAANLDYTITATIDGSDEFNNYASSSDIKTVEFAITNNSENSTMAEIGLNANFMFDKLQDCNDLLFYPDTVSDSEIINEIQNNTFSKNYSVENKKVVFDKVTVNQNSSYRFKIKIANKTDINSGNVLQLITQAKVFTGNASGGTGFLSDMEDTTGLYYFYNSNNANNTVMQGIQTITSGTIPYSTSTTYSLAQPLADLTGLGVIEENIDFFDYNGKLIDYGLTMSNGKIYGTPNNMPDSYEIRFRYNSENKSCVAKSSETDGSYIGKILLKFKKNNTNIADTTIGLIYPIKHTAVVKLNLI